MTPKVSFNVVTWNGERYISELFASLEKQTFPEISARVIDNASDDETLLRLREQRATTVIRNARNLGFAVAHNQGIRLAIDKWEGEDLDHCYVVIANQDLILTPTTIETLVAAMEDSPKAGSAQGKILRAFVEHPEDDFLAQTVCADIVDSTGLRPSRSRVFTDRGSGLMDEQEFSEEGEIFGATGALAIYRASALSSVRYNDEFFDADFFMYREDVDIAWRLRWAGWGSRYVPSSVAYHHRGLYGKEKPGIVERIRNRRSKRPVLAMLSTRNQILLVFKNTSVLNAILVSPWMLLSTARQLIYSFFFEKHVLRGVLFSLKLIPVLWRKRRKTMKNRKASISDLRRAFKL